MNKKISLGAAVTFMAITAAIAVTLTMFFSFNTFNQKIGNIKDREAMYSKIADIDAFVRQNYIGEIDQKELVDMMAKGYVQGLGDKYGAYLTDEEYKELSESYEGKMVGVGIEITQDVSGYMRIISVYEGSPAASAGLAKGDLIIKIGDVDVVTSGYDAAKEEIRGEAGTTLTLTYRRENVDQSIDLVRRKMDIPTIDYRLIGANGFIRIKEFNDNTPEQFKAAIEDLQANGAKGLVFDVRNNGGGTIDSVAEMLDMLLPEGPIVTAYSKDGTEVVNKQSDASEINLPMCVLTNERTASAAELFACALRDYDKAKLVGTKTYGKGVMQRVFPLSDGSALDITIAKYNPPKSENYDGVGLTPDYEVKLSAELQNIFYELTEINDPQLQKAIEVVNAVQ